MSDGAVECWKLETQTLAVQHRVLRLAAIAAGVAGLGAVPRPRARAGRLVEGPEGAVRHKEIQLPGHVTAYRDGDLLRFRRTAVTG